uniref:Histidine N-acetyltransferase C-terminal domain-containing protein n=1 Tax=Branchiostoma floridae TaxID=7739 RepID=C3YMY3_BRAFL|eukprot:XP_002602462.1 hypothetical protein BRAFLDRAFT_63449 [Branchiostoma floridae]
MADQSPNLSFRLASHDDYDAVMRMSKDIYGDTDYLPEFFHSFIDDPDTTIFLTVAGTQVPYVEYKGGPNLWWRQNPAQLAQLDTTGLPDVVPLQTADDDFCAAVQKWLPAGACGGYDGKPIIIVDWDPFTLCPANLKFLQAQNTIYTLNHKGEASLSLSNTYPTAAVRMMPVTIYAMNDLTVQKHLLKHLEDVSSSYRNEDIQLLVFVGLAELEDSIHQFCREALQMKNLLDRKSEVIMTESDIFSSHLHTLTVPHTGNLKKRVRSYISPTLHNQKFCDVRNTNSQDKYVVLVIVLFGIFSLVVLCNATLFCWRKQRARREHIGIASTTLHIGVQAMAVCIPHHSLLMVTDQSREGESSPNDFPLRRLRSRETHWSEMIKGATQCSFHYVTEAHQADTNGVAEAEVYHYDNDDASDADEEAQYHQYDSAAPPPLPVYEETAPKVLVEEESDQPAFHIGNAETDEEEMPYGVAAANSLYQRDMTPNRSDVTSERSYSAYANSCAVEGNRMEERFPVVAEANTLYHQDAAANCSTLTRKHAARTTASGSAADPIQTETVMTDMYVQQTAITRDVTTTSNQSVEDFGILYGSGAATVE